MMEFRIITKFNISDLYFQRPIKTRRLKVDEDIRGKEKLGSNIKFMTNQKIMQGTSLIRILMKSPIEGYLIAP